MAWRTSCTHYGHNESVSRGQPSLGNVRSWLRRSGAGAHLGWNGRAGLTLPFKYWNTGHTASADLLRAVSNARTSSPPFRSVALVHRARTRIGGAVRAGRDLRCTTCPRSGADLAASAPHGRSSRVLAAP